VTKRARLLPSQNPHLPAAMRPAALSRDITGEVIPGPPNPF